MRMSVGRSFLMIGSRPDWDFLVWGFFCLFGWYIVGCLGAGWMNGWMGAFYHSLNMEHRMDQI